ncbi:citramalate synthase [Kiloniella laminariae]|uniref:Citramalate synthase n=1 Tax=Kiloniella laminariae TaxID=454162 RepID=A0ABT4LHN8_9PROT|nr:citramalate synthase [Kiloniella laminariae]MCZ4280618.1 citramalate synthase [Kiloniella laminariae]
MSENRVYLFDSTLRDGQQTQGVDFSVADKTAIATGLDRIGVDYIEGGWPGANPTDNEFFSTRPQLSSSLFVAFGMTRRPGRSVENDPGLASLVNSAADAVCIVGKTWDFHVDVALDIARSENIDMIGESVAFLKTRKQEALFDAEHFFDGYKANPEFAMDCLLSAYQAGARWIVLCDTNGGTLPHEIRRIVGEVTQKIPGTHLGIHCHNDTENAVANSLAAVEAGARQIQGTLNGLGERCGNANLVSLIPSLKLKTSYDIGISDAQLAQLTSLSHMLDERLNRAAQSNMAYVGQSAFTHKGGLHVSAVEKDPRTYEHIEPSLVGNHRHVIVSDQAGRSNVIAMLRDMDITPDDQDGSKMGKLLQRVKDREYEGYSYDGAEASFELLARRAFGEVPKYFSLSRFRVMDDRRRDARGKLVTESEATVTLEVGSRHIMEVSTGNGPVNALDCALRKALLPFYPALEDMVLLDYKVRILTPQDGTRAVTRVMIESGDSKGRRWTTVGVSPNIIDASYNAINDGITWKLFHEKAAGA